MIYKGKRSQIQDNNNFVERYGTITHICPECRKLYSNEIMLHTECLINIKDECNDSVSYIIETPPVDLVCSCGATTMCIDNAMASIIKTLITKGYAVLLACEGHAYNNDGELNYDFPMIIVDRNIKPFIPSIYYNKFKFEIFGPTEISCVPDEDDENSPCRSLEAFNEYKTEMLDLLHQMVNSLPTCPFNYTPRVKP